MAHLKYPRYAVIIYTKKDIKSNFLNWIFIDKMAIPVGSMSKEVNDVLSQEDYERRATTSSSGQSYGSDT